ncbi:MAG: formate/nitrite transporter family protein [Ruminococcaceae bacterium]|nr:formate/nitrite transporter family protein [Oscillospiraceae bacterium]
MQNNSNNQMNNPKGKSSIVYRPQKKNFNFSFDFKKQFNKVFLWNALNVFISGLLGGIAFSIGGIAFLSLNNKSVGSALFTIGFVIIYAYGFGFYTSKIGYSLKNSKDQNIMLAPIWLGNLIGALLMGVLLRLTRETIYDTLYTRANQLCGEKMSDSVGGIIILSIFCGLLMFIATDNFKNAKNAAQKYITLFLVSMVFLLCGFEHFTSSAFLFAAADAINIKAIWYLILMTLGNSVGALIIPLSHSGVKLIQKMAKSK